jgi:hypothetical protein
LYISTVEQDYLDSFSDKQEFWYVKKESNDSEKSGDAPTQGDKWWLPTVKVPPNGLSDSSRRWLQHQKELVNQVLKATMAINANVIMEMDVPDAYMESLPKVIHKTLLYCTTITFTLLDYIGEISPYNILEEFCLEETHYIILPSFLMLGRMESRPLGTRCTSL